MCSCFSWPKKALLAAALAQPWLRDLGVEKRRNFKSISTAIQLVPDNPKEEVSSEHFIFSYILTCFFPSASFLARSL